MQAVKIIFLCVGSAVLYGNLHDQVTARVCVEYFTIGHPRVLNTQSPTLLAMWWGTMATWWAGLFVAIPAVIACRFGSLPPVSAGQLWRHIRVLLVVMGVSSLIAGLCGYFAAKGGLVFLVPPLASMVPPEKHPAFLADLWAHLAAYGCGFFGGLFIAARVWISRIHTAAPAQVLGAINASELIRSD